MNDCQDGSDEQNCGCTSNQFACSDGNQCIESWKRCDQRQDCRLDYTERGEMFLAILVFRQMHPWLRVTSLEQLSIAEVSDE